MIVFTPPPEARLRAHSHVAAFPLTPYQCYCLLWLIENASERDLAALPPPVRSWIWEVRGRTTTTDISLHKTRWRWLNLPPHPF
jgi:hypothetical protein